MGQFLGAQKEEIRLELLELLPFNQYKRISVAQMIEEKLTRAIVLRSFSNRQEER